MKKFHKARSKPLGLPELIAIALGGMVGGGIFSILGVAVGYIGNATPIAILIGGLLALAAAYSYVQLALYYKDEGATYSFFKRTFPKSAFAASAIGWYIVFGYISTLALYAFTFGSYFTSIWSGEHFGVVMKLSAGGILLLFTLINVLSVKGMGKMEDIIVYTKLIILCVISVLLAEHGEVANILPLFDRGFDLSSILIVSSLTFVAYEGFQLVINAINEMDNVERNIPRAIYSAIIIAMIIYTVLAVAALMAIPQEQLIADKEYALAAGAGHVFGQVGLTTVIFGALLATSSAINGTIFGASRLVAVVAEDGYFPKVFAKRYQKHIPVFAIIMLFVCAYGFVLFGGLESILRFGSVTFLLLSFLMAYANVRICKETKSSAPLALLAMFALGSAGGLIIYHECTKDILGMGFILMVYLVLTLCAFIAARVGKRQSKNLFLP